MIMYLLLTKVFSYILLIALPGPCLTALMPAPFTRIEKPSATRKFFFLLNRTRAVHNYHFIIKVLLMQAII